jgi:hypothetical protein
LSYLVHTEKDGLAQALRIIERAGKGHLHEFQSVLCTGLSGIIPAAIFCARHKKSLVVLRKKDESRHSCTEIEGPPHWENSDQNHIIIDDFVDLGSTLRRLQAVTKRPPKFIILYRGYGRALRSRKMIPYPGYYSFQSGLVLKRDRKLRFHFATLPEKTSCESSLLVEQSEIPF